jgi:deoxyribodipyrimidine photolyase
MAPPETPPTADIATKMTADKAAIASLQAENALLRSENAALMGRLIVASFLIKDLLLHWRVGEK